MEIYIEACGQVPAGCQSLQICNDYARQFLKAIWAPAD
jgi:hypothetical protein